MKTEFALLLGLIFCGAVHASIPNTNPAGRNLVPSNKPYYQTAAELQRRLALAGRMSGPELTGSETIEGHQGLAYVTGVADAIQGTSACPKGYERDSGVFSVVGKYLRDHPEKHSWSAAIVVRDALSAAYPCPSAVGPGASV